MNPSITDREQIYKECNTTGNKPPEECCAPIRECRPTPITIPPNNTVCRKLF